jgi:hypothetical protein
VCIYEMAPIINNAGGAGMGLLGGLGRMLGRVLVLGGYSLGFVGFCWA